MFFRLLLHFLPLIILVACKPGRPSDVLSKGKMEDMLYDYHLAEGLAKEEKADSAAYYERIYRNAVFHKYAITQADFDRSMAWYSRHTDELKKIYDAISERLGEAGQEPLGDRIPSSGEASATGDTLNIWHGASSALLQSRGLNRFTFTEKADTTFHEGDRLEWRFSTKWYYSEGNRQAVATIFVYYEGDSVASYRQNIFSSSDQCVSITIGRRRVERVGGLVYQQSPWSDRPRLLALSRFALLKISDPAHKEACPDNQNGQPLADTLAVHKPEPDQFASRRRVRDSLLRDDTLNKRRSHFR